MITELLYASLLQLAKRTKLHLTLMPRAVGAKKKKKDRKYFFLAAHVLEDVTGDGQKIMQI